MGGPYGGWNQWERTGWKEKVKGYVIEQWNPLKLLLKGAGGQERVIAELNLIKIHCMNVWKYHNETTLYNWYMLIRVRDQEWEREKEIEAWLSSLSCSMVSLDFVYTCKHTCIYICKCTHMYIHTSDRLFTHSTYLSWVPTMLSAL
jgi:hypothetical protein